MDAVEPGATGSEPRTEDWLPAWEEWRDSHTFDGGRDAAFEAGWEAGWEAARTADDRHVAALADSLHAMLCATHIDSTGCRFNHRA